MQSTIRALCFAVVLAGFGAAVAASESMALDGLRFAGETGEVGKGEHHKDIITFSGGQFRSLDCEEWGFGAAPYQATRDGGAIHFTATMPSSDMGVLEWKGVIVGDTATARFRWRHQRWYGTIDREYWFKGARADGR